MATRSNWTCGNCGMAAEGGAPRCPKCDFPRHGENSSRTVTVDIAHTGQTLKEAELLLIEAIDSASRERYGWLRVITGRGLINRETPTMLETAQWQGKIRGYELEEHNPGAFLIRLGDCKPV